MAFFLAICRAGTAADPSDRGRWRHGESPGPQSSRVRDAIERPGAKLMVLPPYSPIENVFSKLKAMLRLGLSERSMRCGMQWEP